MWRITLSGPAVWTLPTACEITAHLIRQDPPINGWSHCSARPFKSRRSRTFSSAPRLRRGEPHFCSRVVPLWHISQKHHRVFVRAFVSTFRFYRRMSSTLLCALIFLACALTFSGAQSEYNWFPFFNILWFHLFSWNASGFFCLYSFIFTLLNNYLPAGEPMCTLCICHYCRNQFLAGLHRLCPQAGAQVSSYRCTLCL